MADPALVHHSAPEISGAPVMHAPQPLRASAVDVAPLSRTSLDVRRLRYFRDLLIEGFHHALRPDLTSRTLRTERIALGIDLPELDTVALWSTRNADGTVAIPFIEFILAEVCRTLDALCAHAPGSPEEALNLLRVASHDLDSVRRRAAGGGPAGSLPRLSDVFLEEMVLEKLCAPGGVLDQITRLCESLSPDPLRA